MGTRRLDRGVPEVPEDVVVALALYRSAAREHFVEDHAYCIDVHPLVYTFRASSLLGGHVLRSPEYRTRTGQFVVFERGIGELGDTEVEDLYEALLLADTSEKNIGRFEIAVDHAGRVRRSQTREELHGDPDGAVYPKLTVAFDG